VSTRDEVTGTGEDCTVKNFLIFHLSLKINRLIKSRMMRWAAQVARMGDIRKHTEFRWRNLDNLSIMTGQD